jgi:hypothetical protein
MGRCRDQLRHQLASGRQRAQLLLLDPLKLADKCVDDAARINGVLMKEVGLG